MLISFARVVLVALCGTGAVQLMLYFRGYWRNDQAGWISALIIAVFVLSGTGYVLGGIIGRRLDHFVFRVESIIHKYSTADIIVGTFGLLMGLAIAALLSLSIRGIEVIGSYLPPLIFVIGGYVGLRIALRRREEFEKALPFLQEGRVTAEGLSLTQALPKIVDTSVVIDGRLGDICHSGFIEGEIIVPTFVLHELQILSDSQDALKRAKGRRGLDLLAEMQADNRMNVKVLDRTAEPGMVDSELVKLAREVTGAIVTKDYNLQKIAELSGIRVLNINQLASSVKSVVTAGELLAITVIKQGKEQNQGVGYLDDGTMVVVEGGRGYIGHGVDVIVTSVLQTPSGKMIFAKPADAQ